LVYFLAYLKGIQDVGVFVLLTLKPSYVYMTFVLLPIKNLSSNKKNILALPSFVMGVIIF